MGASRWVAATFVVLLLVSGCSEQDPAQSRKPVGPPATVEPDDPALALGGRAVEALGRGGLDVVMRIGASGFVLPEHEHLLDIDGDRVLSGRADPGGGTIRLIVRDLAGAQLREIDSGMQIPQAAIVRGEDVYFGGIDAHEDDAGLVTIDRGTWVARGDAAPEPILAATSETTIYQAIERSPDGRTVGISRCGEATCSTTLLRVGVAPVEIPKAGLIALANDVALLIGRFSDVTAYAISDGAELWRAETPGIYYERYVTADGARIVISSVDDAGDNDGMSTDELRIEVLEALTGAVQETVLIPTDTNLPWVAPNLSSDRYVALLQNVMPNADEGSKAVQVVDLESGRLLAVELTLGEVP